VRRLIDRKLWTGPLGIARIVLLLSATWLFVTGLLEVIGVTGVTPAKAVLPGSIMLLALGFVGGYQLAQSKRA
jgi:uncharacterized membrane-anchored protein